MGGNKGSNLIEYIIPVALIGIVVGMGLYFSIKEGYIKNFFVATANMEVEQGKATINKNEPPPPLLLVNPHPGCYDGTPEKPVHQCANNSCVIDFGNFLMTDIPSDFNKFIETSGSAAGSDLISNILNQIGNNLEDEGLKEQSESIKKLASLGHNIATIQKELENIVVSCNGDANCVKSYNKKPMLKPDGYDESFMSYKEYNYEESAFAGSIGYAMGGYKRSDLAIAFVNQYKSITDDSAIPDNIKNVITELYWSIGTIGEDFQNNYHYMSSSALGNMINDPLTGEGKSIDRLDPGAGYENFSNYNASQVTHFDSSMICASANGREQNRQCH